MSERAWNVLLNGLNALAIVVVALLYASWFGWIAGDLRNVLMIVLCAVVFTSLAARYAREEGNRRAYRIYAVWGLAISVPMVTLAILRDAWPDPYFQSTLFPAVFAPVMIATFLGYVVLAFILIRSMRAKH